MPYPLPENYSYLVQVIRCRNLGEWVVSFRSCQEDNCPPPHNPLEELLGSGRGK